MVTLREMTQERSIRSAQGIPAVVLACILCISLNSFTVAGAGHSSETTAIITGVVPNAPGQWLYLVKDPIWELPYPIVDSTQCGAAGEFRFEVAPDPDAEYGIRTSSDDLYQTLSLSVGDSIGLRLEYGKQPVLVFDRLGANEAWSKFWWSFSLSDSDYYQHLMHDRFAEFQAHERTRQALAIAAADEIKSKFAEHRYLVRVSRGVAESYFDEKSLDYYHRRALDSDSIPPEVTASIKLLLGSLYTYDFGDVARSRLFGLGALDFLVTIEINKPKSQPPPKPIIERLRREFGVAANLNPALRGAGFWWAEQRTLAFAPRGEALHLVAAERDTFAAVSPDDPLLKVYDHKLQVAQTLTKGAVAPDFKLVDSLGKQVSLRDFADRIVLLHFWGTWCSPCREQLPDVEKLYKEFGANPRMVFVSIALQSKNDFEIWKKFLRDHALGGVELFAADEFQNQVAEDYDLHAIPAYMLLSGGSIIVNPNLDVTEVEKAAAEIRSLLK